MYSEKLAIRIQPYKPLRLAVLEISPPWCTVCTVCMNSLSAVHGLYDGLYDGLYGLYEGPALQAIQRARYKPYKSS